MSENNQGSAVKFVPATTLSELAQAVHVVGNSLDSQLRTSRVLDEPDLAAVKAELAAVVSKVYELENLARRNDVSRRAQGLA